MPNEHDPQSSLDDFFAVEPESKSEPEKTPRKPVESSDSNVFELEEAPEEASGEDDVEEEGLDIKVGAQQFPQNLPPSFLLSIDYSNTHNRAIARLYDPKSKEIFFWLDNTGHKPYLYTDWPLQAVEDRVKRNQGFLKVQSEKLHDLLKDKPVTMTKLVGDNPLAIGGRMDSMRNYLTDGQNISHAWEANIRYRLCYTYDSGLVPGLMYKVENGNLVAVPPDVDQSVLDQFKETIQDEEGLESVIESYSPMFFTEVPDIRRLAVDIEVFTPEVNRVPDPNLADQPVTAIGFSDNEGLEKCFVLKRKGHEEGVQGPDYPKIELVYYYDEAEMLVDAFKLIDAYPIVLTFVGDSFDLMYLHQRAKKLRIDMNTYCPIRIRGANEPRRQQALLDRGIHIDMYKFFSNPSIKIYALSGKYQRENLNSIAEGILGVTKLDLTTDISSLPYYELAHYCWLDANLVMQFTQYENNLLLRLIILLMRISRMSMDEVTRFYISSWISSLFRQEHRSRGFLIPRRIDIDSMKQTDAQTEAMIGGKQFKGAIVIDPVPGVHFNATVLDFASLYPTIMKTHNISYETVDCPHEECMNATHNQVPETNHWTCTKRKGMVSQTIGFFRDTRVKWFKPKAKDKKLDERTRNWYSVVEKALKVFVNASYGVTGAPHFELFCMPAAESVTAYGRDAMMRTKAKSEEMGIQVLYGDTDSVFLDNPSIDQQNELVRWSREELGIDLEVEKTYKYVALSDRKKNYIGVYTDGRIDVKGLSGKKRNTPDFAQEAFKQMLEILSRVDDNEGFETAKEEIREVVNCVLDKLEGKADPYSPEELAFRVQIKKPLDSYETDIQHVRAAKMLVEWSGDKNKVPPGTIVEFIKTKDKEGILPVEMAKERKYWIDKDQYIDILRSVFEQVLDSVGLDFEEFLGFTTLDQFF